MVRSFSKTRYWQKMQSVSASSDQSPTSPPHLGQMAIRSSTLASRMPDDFFDLCFDRLSLMCFPPSFLREPRHPAIPPGYDFSEVSLRVRLGKLGQLFPLPHGVDMVRRRHPPPCAVAL